MEENHMYCLLSTEIEWVMKVSIKYYDLIIKKKVGEVQYFPNTECKTFCLEINLTYFIDIILYFINFSMLVVTLINSSSF